MTTRRTMTALAPALVVLTGLLGAALPGGPPPASAAAGIAAVAAGGAHSCVLTSAGGVKCWGENAFGQLGNGNTDSSQARCGYACSTTPVDVSGLTSGVASIAAGAYHMCAVTTAGGLKCWGLNNAGQLGNGTTVGPEQCGLPSSACSTTPVDVSGLSSGVAAVAAGGLHTCAVTTSGGVKCWGWNNYGQLGNGSTTYSSIPLDVFGLGSGVAAVAAGGAHSCVLTVAGGVKCWGLNEAGVLGNGTTVGPEQCGFPPEACSTTPLDVSGLSTGVAAVSAGVGHTCALTTSGGLKCWGGNTSGQLGSTTASSSSVPLDVSGLSSGVASVAAGHYHSCAVTTSGGVKCWGENLEGQLGNGSITLNSGVPVDVSSLSAGVAAVAGGGAHSCAVTSAGGVKCWGLNGDGQLGRRFTADSSSVPIDVSGLTWGVATIAAGTYHACAITDGSGLKCWGLNDYGVLGNGVSSLGSGVAAVATGDYHTCAVTAAGGVKCWGWNESGRLGNGSTTDSSVPVAVAGLSSGIASISAGSAHTCALTSAGGVTCWGNNGYGQLGNGNTTNSSVPVAVTGLSSGVVAIEAAFGHTCAVTAAGGVKCWGANYSGQLGNGSTTNSSIPVGVSGLSSGVAAVAGGDDHSCAVTAVGGVKCWGRNYSGQLGDGSTTDSSIPVAVSGLSSGVAAVASGHAHSCAVTDGGAVTCWGLNGDAQLGNSSFSGPETCLSFACSTTPVAVSDLTSGVAAVAAGGTHTCALTSAGGVKCWGYNSGVLLGNDTTTPADVVGLGAKKYPDADSDGDTIPNGSDANDDNDGCTDVEELGPNPVAGGARNPHNFWDFYDVPTGTFPNLVRDGSVSSLDIFAVIGRFNATGDGGIDPLSTPPAAPAYHTAYDRGPSGGANVWNLTAANGSIASTDIFGVLAQFNHSCA